MSRKLSLLILFGTVVAIGVLFFNVIRPFIFPLFFAGVLAVLFRPFFGWVKRICRGRGRLAAAVTTLAIIAMVLLPLGGMLTLAGVQLLQAGRDLVAAIDLPEGDDPAGSLIDPDRYPQIAETIDWARRQVGDEVFNRFRELTSQGLLSGTKSLYERTSALAGDLVTFVVGLVIMFLALFYFLADGESLLAEAQRLSPLEDEDENALLEQFDRVCRGVVMGTVVAGLVQGVLAGIGFMIVGVERIWLLAVLTIMFSFIPFLGAAMIWICVVIGLLIEQRYGAAVFLTIYGTIIVSGSDNLIKAYMIGDRAQMHPLIALVTVLGALQLVGLWGIFIGPISAAFFYALLNILRQRLLQHEDETGKAVV